MRLRLSKPRKMVRSSRVDQPPVSGVPVAGATISSTVSNPTPHTGTRARRLLTGRIQRIDIERQVDGVRGTNPIQDPLDDAVGANGVDLAGLDDLEAAIAIVLVVTWPAECCADSCVDVAVVPEQAFLRRVVEVCSVVDAGYLRRRAAEHFGPP